MKIRIEKMKIRNVILSFIGLVVICGVIVIGFSSLESRFQCDGQITTDEGSESATIYIKLEEYRWWVGLWGDSDGSLILEIPNELHKYYSHIEEVGGQLQIHLDQGNLHGNFSKLSKRLALKIPYYGFFEGKCENIK
jgi:hypothetical protein